MQKNMPEHSMLVLYSLWAQCHGWYEQYLACSMVAMNRTLACVMLVYPTWGKLVFSYRNC